MDSPLPDHPDMKTYGANVDAASWSQVEFESAFRNVKLLILSYIALSLGTLVAAFVMRNHPHQVTPVVWVRGVIVAMVSLLTYRFFVLASRGRRLGLLLLQVGPTIMVIAVAVFLAIPGSLPLWMKVEQGACGVLLLGVMRVSFSWSARDLFR